MKISAVVFLITALCSLGMSSQGFTEFYLLPEGADFNHPALNTTLIIELLSHGVDPANLPSLPPHIQSGMQALTKRSMPTDPPELACETSALSPWAYDVQQLSKRLQQKALRDRDCCQLEEVGKCSQLVGFQSAAVSLCGARRGVCLKCKDVAGAVERVAEACRKGFKAAGRVAWMDTVDVAVHRREKKWASRFPF
ncbi:hypothetical protein FN846DRAFT_889348 [Sphaerosporella brunnea]|uniref:Uncharacterized protein n=1 Tax=Sphaerosporella brunnea TaxID=1250544 RepID=A0A5J5F011_9PEZI|nr:hypothetical protein FN846DRAFT_889348 [Sphaerosporella brunnea]